MVKAEAESDSDSEPGYPPPPSERSEDVGEAFARRAGAQGLVMRRPLTACGA